MEKIIVKTKPNQFSANKTKEKKLFTGLLDQFLLEKARNMIKSQQLGGNYQFNNVTDLICESLRKFRDKELELSGNRNLHCLRQNTSWNLPTDLAEFYLSLPKGQRIGILERCLSSFLNQLA